MDTKLPKPPVPPECDLRKYAYMPLHVAILANSDTWRMAKYVPGASRACLNLWMQAYYQVPAGSLPDDDFLLKEFADVVDWNVTRDIALRHWERHSDGRLYHQALAKVVLETWTKHAAVADAREANRYRQRKKRHKDQQSGHGVTPRDERKSHSVTPRDVPVSHGLRREEKRRDKLATLAGRAREGVSNETSGQQAPADQPADLPLRTEPSPLAGEKESEVQAVGDQVLLLCGVEPKSWGHGYDVVKTWLDKGCDPFEDIFPTVSTILRTNPDFEPPRNPGGLKYFTAPIARHYAQRLANGEDASIEDEPRGMFGTGDWKGHWALSDSNRQWGIRLQALLEDNFWLQSYGGKPGEDYCQVPKDLQEEFIKLKGEADE